MTRILFVDDEQSILDGLRNVLRKYRNVWEMGFVTSGHAAVESMAQKPWDVVVSDMRMPGMDGVQLLKYVREKHPATARIMLTGQATKDDLLQALQVGQQILSKPCDPPVLISSLERICKVQSLLGNQQLHALVGALDSLPSFPRSYQELSVLLRGDDVATADIARIVERDPALSVRTLSMANAAYFGLRRPTTSISEAVRHIGFSLLRALALSTDIFAKIDGALLSSAALRQLPGRSLLRAQLAKGFVLDRSLADEAFTAALLLDIGMIVLGQLQPERYLQLLEAATLEGRPVQELELQRLGFSHAEVGAYLLGMWGLPASLVEAVACHHLPALAELAPSPVIAAVHIADVFSDPDRTAEMSPQEGLATHIAARPEIAERLAGWHAIALEALALS